MRNSKGCSCLEEESCVRVTFVRRHGGTMVLSLAMVLTDNSFEIPIIESIP